MPSLIITFPTTPFTSYSHLLIFHLIFVYCLKPEFVDADDSKCKRGSFKDFEGICTSSFYESEHKELFAPVIVYCTGNDVVPDSTTQFCGCDCKYAHLATGEFKACVQENDKKIACQCEYKENENPCEDKNTWDPPLNSSDSSFRTNNNVAQVTTTTNESRSVNKVDLPHWDKVDGLVSVVVGNECKPGMEGVITAVCEAGPLNYLANELYGMDLCAIDCRCSHGSKTFPYGLCKKVEACPTPISLCYCLK